jgi:4-amino-4-deoxy-L-arabinose transferase-like glycosyltransferase
VSAPSGRRRAATIAVLIALTLVAAGLRFWGLDFGLPHLMARPDEEVILQRTAQPAEGVFDLRWGTYPSAFLYVTWLWGELGVKVGQLAGVVPAGGYLDVLRARPDLVLLVDRVLSALVGTLTVPLVVAVARPTLGLAAAAGAGFFVAGSFLHVRESHTIKPDVLLSLVMLAAVAGIAPLAGRATTARGARAGLLVGLAMAVKYPGVLLMVPLYLAAVLGSTARGWRRLVPGPAIVGGLTAVAVFFATSPDLLWNPSTLRDAFNILPITFATLPGGGIADPNSPLMAAFREAFAGGYPDYSSRPWWDGYVRYWWWLRSGAGLPAAVLAPVAVGWGLVAREPLARTAAVATLAYYLVVASAVTTQSRYLTPIVPLLALLEAGMLAALARRFLPDRRRAALAAALATVAIVVPALSSAVAHDRIAARTDTRVLTTRWLAGHAAPGDTLVVFGNRIWPWGAPQIPPGLRAVAAPPTVDGLTAARARWVVTHEHPLFASRLPEGLPALAPRLRLVAEFDPFVPGRRDEALFEPTDAYYVPMHGFDAVTRPGPHFRIYAFE